MTAFIIQTDYGVVIIEAETRKRLAEVATEDEAYEYCYQIDAYVAN